MDTLKQLEYKYSKDFHGYFEDLVALLFCVENKQTHGVNRRINQPGIEADPIVVDGKRIAFQAKYYGEGVGLSDRKNDLLKSISDAAKEKVDKLIIYTNKDLTSIKSQKNDSDTTKPRIKPAYEQEIDALAEMNSMEIEWQTGSSINTTLEKPEFAGVRKIYLGTDENIDGFKEFYEYAVEKVCNHESNSIYGDISLMEGYIEPYISVNRSLKEYLHNWTSKKSDNVNDQVLVIYGEPGHGKTSLCYKAMYDYIKTGWLSGAVDNVFCFSLNPSDTNLNPKDKVDLKKLLCWGDMRENIVHIKDCKNALVFFDGFDELLDSASNLKISEFIRGPVNRFVRATKAWVVITTRRMSIERELDNYSRIIDATEYQTFEIQPMSYTQQTDWIENYALYCEKKLNKRDTKDDLLQKAVNLREYVKIFKGVQKELSEKTIRLLAIPIVFRIMVEFQYDPRQFTDSAKLYEDLFELTWNRRSRLLSEGESANKKQLTVLSLAKHALICFENDADSAITDSGIEGYDYFWTYQFYTKRINIGINNNSIVESRKLRIGFLHRSFYQFFLAKYILISLLEADGKDDLFVLMAQLTRNRIDIATLKYLRELYTALCEEKKGFIQKGLEQSFHILRETDAILMETNKMAWIKTEIKPGIITPLEAGNNLLWNTISIYSSCGYSNDNKHRYLNALRSYSLSDIDLSSAELGGAHLEGAYLERANLKRANLKGAHLEGANLKGAHLEGAHLEEATLIDANLKEAHLEGAYLVRSSLKGAILEEAHLEWSHLEEAILEEVNLIKVNLQWSHLERANLKRAILRDTNLEGASLEETNLNGASLYKTNLYGTILEREYLNETKYKWIVVGNGRN